MKVDVSAGEICDNLVLNQIQTSFAVGVKLLMTEVLHFCVEEFSPKCEFRLGFMAFFSNVFFQWKTTFSAYERI